MVILTRWSSILPLPLNQEVKTMPWPLRTLSMLVKYTIPLNLKLLLNFQSHPLDLDSLLNRFVLLQAYHLMVLNLPNLAIACQLQSLLIRVYLLISGSTLGFFLQSEKPLMQLNQPMVCNVTGSFCQEPRKRAKKDRSE
ncbi:hypothetical protein Tco_0631003 [Tanacetum coccineum]